MKLNLKISSATPRVEKIRFEANLVELFDAYMEFYQGELKADILKHQAISEMLTAFMHSDRHFMQWYRLKKDDKNEEIEKNEK
jgi:hypothetical protein